MALTDKLTAIADAIREKTGNTEPLTLDQMPTEIAGIETGGGGGAIIEYGSYTPAEDTVGLKFSSGRMAETHTFPSFLIMKKRLDDGGNALTASTIKDGALQIWEKISVESAGSGGYYLKADVRSLGRPSSAPITIYVHNEENIFNYADNYFDGTENIFYLFTYSTNMKYLAGNTYDWIAIW